LGPDLAETVADADGDLFLDPLPSEFPASLHSVPSSSAVPPVSVDLAASSVLSPPGATRVLPSGPIRALSIKHLQKGSRLGPSVEVSAQFPSPVVFSYSLGDLDCTASGFALTRVAAGASKPFSDQTVQPGHFIYLPVLPRSGKNTIYISSM
jgi:hypothetical protein